MIYFQGCTAREKIKNISISTQKILNIAEMEYEILSNEKCCGSILLRTGFQEDAAQIMKSTFKQLDGKKVVVSCAGCYRTFKIDYPKYLGKNVDVIHISELLKELIDQGKIKVAKKNFKVTYHDPCHLGRHMGEYENPRKVIESFAELVEMDRNRENSRCCGSGGGVRSAFPELSAEIALRRIDDAQKTGVNTIVTCCPFCVLNMESVLDEDKSQMKEDESQMKVIDLSQFLRGMFENE